MDGHQVLQLHLQAPQQQALSSCVHNHTALMLDSNTDKGIGSGKHVIHGAELAWQVNQANNGENRESQHALNADNQLKEAETQVTRQSLPCAQVPLGSKAAATPPVLELGNSTLCEGSAHISGCLLENL